jgi:hypothetical protein
VQAYPRPQYCKLLCRDGQWRGPYCGDDPHGVKGDKDTRVLGNEISLAEDVLKSACVLSTVPAGLEMRHGHKVLDLSSGDQLPHSSTLMMRCQDHTAAMVGSATTQCMDGRWSHSLPVCRSTDVANEYSGGIVMLNIP